ncbi:hypothetical protein KIN20_008875 [Parelaphostrongylus tenuis]|uniref:Uncharacterized protein n=1 Tax=Parelaphostrongylus tenuis TaxID=148309 RepID=A0AAD5MPP0_PARTN|nr:hypothetical protein KIN20_008875 [Parelaphostrongylus tenuis]
MRKKRHYHPNDGNFLSKLIIWPINRDQEDRVKLIEYKSPKRLKKIRLCQPVIGPMIPLCSDKQIRKILKDAGARMAQRQLDFARFRTSSKEHDKAKCASSSS